MTGSVLWFDERLGYGFIKDDNGDEIYFHWTQISTGNHYKTIYAGTPVSFDIFKNGDATAATNVTPMDRVNKETNKPILMVAFADVRGQIPIEVLHHRISRFASTGLVHINERDGILISSDKELESHEVSTIRHIIFEKYDDIIRNIGQGLREVFNTEKYNIKYDIMFL